MKDLTANSPKCLLEINGKSLLQTQLDYLRSLGINDITIIKGYLQEKISFPGINYYVNEDYLNNNILESLFHAEGELVGDVIVLYSDIIYEKNVLVKQLESEHDISIVTDVKWRLNYLDRKDHPLEEAENVVFDENLQVQRVGKDLKGDKNSLSGEFIGMMKLKRSGTEIFKMFYHSCKKKYKTGPFQSASTFQVAYLTDMIQELVDNSVVVHCVPVENGWKEIDTAEDYYKAKNLFE